MYAIRSYYACRRVAVAQDLLQTLGHLLEQFVAHGVAEGVVDVLEAVEIEKQHRQLAPLPFRLGDGMLQAVLEQQPVG